MENMDEYDDIDVEETREETQKVSQAEEKVEAAGEDTDTKEESTQETVMENAEEKTTTETGAAHIYALRTAANREDQVMDFLASNINKKGLHVLSIIRPHGMRGYIFVEASTRSDAEQACFNVPYARGVLQNEIQYKEIEHMLEQVKQVINIEKGDIVELISGPFKREKAKITRIEKAKEEVVVELLEAAVPIPITVKLDAVKVIRREKHEEEKEMED